MKRIIFAIILLCVVLPVFSQLRTTIEFDFENTFEGTWVAKSGTKSYELVFQKEKLYFEQIDTYAELILGSITYLENNKVVRTLPIKGSESPLVGSMDSVNVLRLSYNDYVKHFSGDVVITLSPTNSRVGTWVLRRNERGMISDVINKTPYDLPAEIEFIKQ